MVNYLGLFGIFKGKKNKKDKEDKNHDYISYDDDSYLDLYKKPLTVECDECEGTGRVYCDVCNGDGGYNSEVCKACKGEGGMECPYCEGSGEATYLMGQQIKKNNKYNDSMDSYFDDDKKDESLDIYEAALIWISSGKDEDYTFGYSDEELEDALKD